MASLVEVAVERSGPREVIEFVECVVDGEPLAIPLERAGRWVECTIAALPLSEAWIRGIAVFDDQVLLCVGTGPRESRSARKSRGVVLDVQGRERATRWLLEVEVVVGMGRLHVRTPGSKTTSFVGDAMTQDGRPIRWLDVAALAENTFTAPRARTA